MDATTSKRTECRECGKSLEIPEGPSRWARPRLICRECLAAFKKRHADAQGRAAEAARKAELDVIRADPEAALREVGISAAWLDADFQRCPDVAPSLLAQVRAWSMCPEGFLYLHGPPGSGKTWLAVAAMRELLVSGRLAPRDSCFIREGAFLEARRGAYGNGRGPRITPRQHRVPLLVLDDLGASRLTDWGLGEIAELITARHAHARPTCITSNLPPTRLAETVDARVLSRIAESRLLLDTGGRDLRLTGTLRRGPQTVNTR